MKVFRVVTQHDGYTVKAPGVSETEIKQVDRRYAAETMQQVWDEIESIRSDPEKDLIAIIEEYPAITVLGSTAPEWQPVETAPYATTVLAWIYHPKNPIASGPAIAIRCFLEEDEPESYGEHRMTVGCWWANNRYYHAGSDTGYVTHWMPIQRPPSSD